MSLNLKLFNTGPLQVNTYVLIDEHSKESVIIDLGGDFDEIDSYINSKGAVLKFILNTHGHFDHILGEDEAQKKSNVKVYVHKDDEELIKNLSQSLMMFGMPQSSPPKITGFVNEGDWELQIGEHRIKTIHTPGHTQGGVCYLIDNMLFSGDTLFEGSVGRTDLPGGDFNLLAKMIREKLYILDDKISVYPGHGGATTIGREKKYNGFVR